MTRPLPHRGSLFCSPRTPKLHLAKQPARKSTMSSTKIYSSFYPDLDIKSVDLLTHIFSNPAATAPNHPLYIDAISGKQYTYKDVSQRTKSLANGLQQKFQLQGGEIVALFSPNTIDYAIVCHAIIGSGATVAPISASLTDAELHAQLLTGRARFIIVHSSLLSIAQKAVQNTTIKIIVLDGPTGSDGQPTCESMAASFPPSDLVNVPASELASKIAFICFSSGTSGPAKGVTITHRNMVANLQQMRSLLVDTGLPSQRPKRQVALAFLPFSHAYGLSLYLCQSIQWGTTTIVMPKFELDLFLSCVEKYRPDELAIVPPVALMMVKDDRLADYNLRSVRLILSAAAPLGGELASALEAKFKKLFGTKVFCYQAWGLTETSPLASGTPNDCRDKRKLHVGRLAPNMQLRIVNHETMEDVDSPQMGEILLRGPNITPGYFKNPEATKAAFYRDADGTIWFRTGDIGSIDDEGFITLFDRIKEMIKYNGHQVIPSELEALLLEHPDIADAAVVGQWADDRATELPVAFVVLKNPDLASQESRSRTVTAMHSWINPRVANYKRLRGGIRFVKEIPKSPSGKTLRRYLREQLQESKKPKANL